MLEIFGMRAQRKAEEAMHEARPKVSIEVGTLPYGLGYHAAAWLDPSGPNISGVREPPARIWHDVNNHMTAELDRAAALFGRNGNGSSIAHAVGFWLVRKFGASKASQLADLIVKAVQMESRKAGGGE